MCEMLDFITSFGIETRLWTLAAPRCFQGARLTQANVTRLIIEFIFAIQILYFLSIKSAIPLCTSHSAAAVLPEKSDKRNRDSDGDPGSSSYLKGMFFMFSRLI
jgi:hypothetical protein